MTVRKVLNADEEDACHIPDGSAREERQAKCHAARSNDTALNDGPYK
jgi:hypothetical protein